MLAAATSLTMASPALASWGSPMGGWSSTRSCTTDCTASSQEKTTNGIDAPATSDQSDNGIPELTILGAAGGGLILLALLRRRKAASETSSQITYRS